MSAAGSAIGYRAVAGETVLADAPLRRRVGAVYAEAFGAPPYRSTPETAAAWADDGLVRHAGYPGFRLVVAEQDDALLGFAYGLLGAEDQWFTRTLRERLPEVVSERWLGEHGELVELAVSAAARGRGVGGRLHDEALAGIRAAGARTALLAVHVAAVPARSLYLARGWQPVADLGDDTLLLGLRLR